MGFGNQERYYTVALRDENANKNRYMNVLPCMSHLFDCYSYQISITGLSLGFIHRLLFLFLFLFQSKMTPGEIEYNAKNQPHGVVLKVSFFVTLLVAK